MFAVKLSGFGLALLLLAGCKGRPGDPLSQAAASGDMAEVRRWASTASCYNRLNSQLTTQNQETTWREQEPQLRGGTR
jgi:hypothetical protein